MPPPTPASAADERQACNFINHWVAAGNISSVQATQEYFESQYYTDPVLWAVALESLALLYYRHQGWSKHTTLCAPPSWRTKELRKCFRRTINKALDPEAKTDESAMDVDETWTEQDVDRAQKLFDLWSGPSELQDDKAGVHVVPAPDKAAEHDDKSALHLGAQDDRLPPLQDLEDGTAGMSTGTTPSVRGRKRWSKPATTAGSRRRRNTPPAAGPTRYQRIEPKPAFGGNGLTGEATSAVAPPTAAPAWAEPLVQIAQIDPAAAAISPDNVSTLTHVQSSILTVPEIASFPLQ